MAREEEGSGKDEDPRKNPALFNRCGRAMSTYSAVMQQPASRSRQAEESSFLCDSIQVRWHVSLLKRDIPIRFIGQVIQDLQQTP